MAYNQYAIAKSAQRVKRLMRIDPSPAVRARQQQRLCISQQDLHNTESLLVLGQ